MTTRDPNDRPAEGEADGWHYGTRVEQPLDVDPNAPQTTTPEDHADEDRGTTAATGSERMPRQDRASRSDNAQNEEPQDKAPDGQPEKANTKNDEPPGSSKAGGDGTDDKGEPQPSPPRKRVFVVAGLVLVCLLAWGAYGHWRASGAATDTQSQTVDAVPEVRTTEAKRDDAPIELTLPGQTEAFATANIYPRATGYITVRNVDIGSRVKKGDLLVHITAPDLDQQLAQAKAQLGQVQAAEAQAGAQVSQAEANLNLAKVTLARTATLTQQGYDTLQNRDNQVANQQSQQANLETARAGVKVAQANTRAQQATVDRLAALAGFEDVKAPFDGVVTTRNVDLGDLVNADTSSATAIFSIAEDDTIRVTVQVPQNSSAGVGEGVPASIEVPSSPGTKLSGTVTRSSVALLSSARTLDTEVDVPNPDGHIRPGLFVYVTLHIPRVHPQVTVPAETLIFNQKGLQVAVADGEKAALRTVKIDRDFGTTVALSEGLNGGEQVILSPPALLRDGSKIKAQKAEDEKADPAKGAAPAGGNAAKGDDKGGPSKSDDPAKNADKPKGDQG